MTLGCVFIFVCVLALFRRRMRAKRAQRTAAFAASKNIDARGVGWRARLGSLFSRKRKIPKEDKVALRVAHLRNLEEERHMAAIGKLGGGGTEMGSVSSSYAPSAGGRQQRRLSVTGGDADSFYSQVTGLPARAPVPRQPVRIGGGGPGSTGARYSVGGGSAKSITEAQRYAQSVEQPDDLELGTGGGGGGSYWLVPAGTGTSQESRNPFRR